MDWKQVQSVEELKILGKLKEVASCISSDLGGEVVPKNSWDKLWAYIADKRPPHLVNNLVNFKYTHFSWNLSMK